MKTLHGDLENAFDPALPYVNTDKCVYWYNTTTPMCVLVLFLGTETPVIK